MSEASSEEASLSDVFYILTSGDRFVQLTSALFYQMRGLYNRGLHPPQSKANQFLGSGSQPIIAATDQLFYLTIHPVSRLSTAPVSDETPFIG